MRESLERLAHWLQAREDEHLEFKEAKSSFEFEKLADYCCALANEKGGKMILGVTDVRPRRVVGSQAFQDLGRTKAGLADRLHLRIEAEEIEHSNGRVLVFHVPSRPIGMPIHHGGRYWMRSGEQLKPMLPDMLKRILDESGPDFTSEICSQAALSDLEPTAIEDFRARWAQKSKNERLRGLALEQLLDDNELRVGGQLTYAALILFGKNNALGKFLAQSEVVFEYRSGETAGPAQQRLDFRRGFFSFYEELWRSINVRNDQQHFQDGLFVWDIPTFNERAVREAILNAISHRDYRMAGSVFVRQYPRRLEIVSPGGFPFGITPENILWEQAPRNRRIAETFARCGLVERAGQGMNLIFESCIRESKEHPDFSHTDDHHVWLTLNGEIQHPEFLRFLEKVGQERLESFSTGEFLVLNALRHDTKIPEGLESNLKRLLELGIVESVGKGGGTRYLLSRSLYAHLGKKGDYTRRKGLDRETHKELLLKHLKESAPDGSPLAELEQVIPHLSRRQIQDLLHELAGENRAVLNGQRRWARWIAKDKKAPAGV